jgi:CRP-like cAMP-binding protein
MDLREYAAGEYLMRQGDPAEFLLLVLSGRAWAHLRNTSENRLPVGVFGPGDVVGEMSLIIQEPRTADVIARTAMRALALSATFMYWRPAIRIFASS